ncbi:MAG: FecR domain-containing protein, partial [Bacteroidota bacterium]
AASIALLVAALVAFWPDKNVDAPLLASTADGQRTEVQLEDGSTVWLNERSELRFAWQDGERRAELTGEAFFEVMEMPDQPFIILAGDTETRVLGTSFNLRAYPEEEVVELDVETGLVSFTQAATPEKRLDIPAGKGAVASVTGLVEEEKAVNAQGWRINELQYKDTPIAQVVAELEKQYKITLIVENKATLWCPISLRLRRESLEEDLKAVLFFLDGSLEVVEEEKIYKLLHTKSCE